MPLSRSTGLSNLDAQHDFLRARRRATIARLATALRLEPGDLTVILPYGEVVEALGFVSERRLGLQVVSIAQIAGSVDRQRDFDRHFRPTTSRVRARWERIAAAMRRGEELPPVDLYKIGEIYFVRDGHHRVSVACALGQADVNAYVTEVITKVGIERPITLADLPLKSHERVFYDRVPLPAADRGAIQLTDPWDYALLAEGVEAWGFRALQQQGEPLDRQETAQLWFETEYQPVVETLRESGLIGDSTETEAYLRVAAERYRLLRTHSWSEDVLQQLLTRRRPRGFRAGAR